MAPWMTCAMQLRDSALRHRMMRQLSNSEPDVLAAKGYGSADVLAAEEDYRQRLAHARQAIDAEVAKLDAARAAAEAGGA